MSYGLIYKVPFAALDNTPCVVEIEREGYTGGSTELIAGETPFTVDIDDEEFLYTPTRFSTATLSVVGSEYLQSLFSTEYRQYRVTLKVNNAITWCGFIKPELYTQDYSSEQFTLDIECVSAMSVLEFINYKTEGDDKRFVSLWSLLRRCVAYSAGRYEAVYVPYVYARSREKYMEEGNVIDEMLISEQNFFDEDGEPMKMKEVLEEICKFLNWTCVDWKGELYFIDVDHSGTYHRFSTDLSDKTNAEINEMSIQDDIGFMGAEHKLDIIPGYNKVRVKCSNYPVADLDFSINYDDLGTLVALNDIVAGDDVSHRVLMLPADTEMMQYAGSSSAPVGNIGEYKGDYGAEELLGALPMKYCNYKMENKDGGKVPNITEYNYTNVVRIRLKNSNGSSIGGYTPVFKLKSPCVAYPPGVFCISASAKYFKNSALSPLTKDKWGGDLRVGFKLFVGGNDFTTDEACLGSSLYKCSYLSFGKFSDADYKEIDNDKKLSDPYTGAAGKMIYTSSIATPGVLAGDLEFVLLASLYPSEVDKYGLLLQNFTIKFIKQDGGISSNGSDRIYENVINENYINELEDIDFKISSYNEDGAGYSKVMYAGHLSFINDGYVKDNLYNSIMDSNKRPEELLITRIVNHYKTTRIKLTQVLKHNQYISPNTVLSDRFMVNKKFINVGGTIDYKMNRFNCIMLEI